MSKHSHWAKIKREKGAADRQKAIVASKMLKLVFSAAKQGGGDPDMNFKLRLAVDMAKSAGVTKDTIERAIAKATGTGAEAEQVESLLYEAYGPGGAALLIECLSSNRNKTVAEVKHALTQEGGSLASAGAVQWMFNRKGVLRFPRAKDDAFELSVIDAGADDVVYEEDGYTIYTKPDELEKVKNILGGSPEYAGFAWIPKDKIPLADEARTKLDELIDALNDLEDVNEVFSNTE